MVRFVLCRRTKPASGNFAASRKGGDGAPSEKYFPKVVANGERILLERDTNREQFWPTTMRHWACSGNQHRCAEKNLALIEQERERRAGCRRSPSAPASRKRRHRARRQWAARIR